MSERKMERKTVLLIVLAVVAVAAIPGRMAWSMRSAAVSETETVRLEVEELETRIVRARKDQERSAELNEQLQALAAALPPDADLASVVEQLAALAREANVTWKTSSQTQPILVREARSEDEDAVPTTAPGEEATTDTTVAAPTTTSYLLEVDLEGTPANLTTYLEKIRSLPRLLTVERMTWAWREGPTGQPNAQIVTAHLTVKASTWSGAPKSVAGASPTTTPAATP